MPLDIITPVKLAFVVTLPAVKLEAVPVIFVPTNAEGVPKAGVTKVGEVPNTNKPEPVSSVTAVIKFALEEVVKNVAIPEPKPETPVEIGRRGKDRWRFRWFANKFPAVDDKGSPSITTHNDFYTFSDAYGYHEIIVETPGAKQLWDLKSEELQELFDIYRERIADLSKVKNINLKIFGKVIKSRNSLKIWLAKNYIRYKPQIRKIFYSLRNIRKNNGKILFINYTGSPLTTDLVLDKLRNIISEKITRIDVAKGSNPGLKASLLIEKEDVFPFESYLTGGILKKIKKETKKNICEWELLKKLKEFRKQINKK